jgi:hypothetical protein
MKKYLLLIFACIGFWALVSAQDVITYDYQKNRIENNQNIPAEKHFAITGFAFAEVAVVEVNLYTKNGLNQKKPSPIYTAHWQRGMDTEAKAFYVPVAYKLKGDQEYDIEMNYYRWANPNEIKNIKEDLMTALDAYLSQSLISQKSKISLTGKWSEALDDLNSIARESLTYYYSPASLNFDSFSDLIADKLKQIDKGTGSKAKRLFANKSKREAIIAERDKDIEELDAMLRQEVSFLFNSGMAVLAENRVMDNLETEHTRNVITFHGGYSGVFLNRGGSDYESGFNAGLTLPFGKRDLAKPFWSKSAIVAGIYFKNFDLDAGERATGPFIGVPFYLGFGYKVLPFIRLVGGAVVLQSKYDDTVLAPVPDEEIYFKPFVGLVLDLDVWFNLRK